MSSLGGTWTPEDLSLPFFLTLVREAGVIHLLLSLFGIFLLRHSLGALHFIVQKWSSTYIF